MDASFTPEQQELRRAAREFLEMLDCESSGTRP